MDNIEIVVGTYDGLILGYKLISKVHGGYDIETSFTEDAHEGALRCLHVSSSGTLVSSSSHTSVRLHNLVKRLSLGELYQHDDQVNCVAFYKHSHMLTASDDGTVCLWKTKNWEMLRLLKGHKAHVLAVAIHPSGKLALSVGSDRSLVTWDLLTGKLAFHRKMKEAAINILFTPDGKHYVLVYTRKIEVCRLEDTKVVVEIPSSWRINSVCFIQDDVLAIGGDGGSIPLVEIYSGKQLVTLDMANSSEDNFSSRVRCVCATVCNQQNLVLAATSNGNLQVFQVNVAERTAGVLLRHAARVRITCMAVYNSADTPHLSGEMSKAREQTEKSSHKKQFAHKNSDDCQQSPSLCTGAEAAVQQLQLNGKQLVSGHLAGELTDRVESLPGRKRTRQQQESQVNKKNKPCVVAAENTGRASQQKVKQVTTSLAPNIGQHSSSHLKKLKFHQSRK